MDDAYASLRGLIDAIDRGDYVLASVEAEALLDARERAKEQGYALGGLDDQITARLGGVVELLPLRVDSSLSSILGVLYPDLPDEDVPGGGSEIIVGPIFTGGTGDGTSTGTGGTDGTNDDGSVGGDGGSGDGDDADGPVGGGDGPVGGGDGPVGGGDGPVGGGDGSEGPASLGPGGGRAWGHSHKPPHAGPGNAPAGGGPPPWANGNANGHSKHNR
jgi:hypothetical protein